MNEGGMKMSGFLTEPIILSGKQSVKFINSLYHPDLEYLEKVNKIFDKIDEDISVQRNGMDLEVEIEGLDLSFIEEELQEESISFSDIELNTEVSFVLGVRNMDNKLSEKMNRLITVGTYMDNQNKTKREACVYNEIGKDKLDASVKGKDNDYLINVCKAEQIIIAA